MNEGLRKIWMYLIPLGLLAVVATCDTDFDMKNPFSSEDTADTATTGVAGMDSIEPLDIDSDSSIIIHSDTTARGSNTSFEGNNPSSQRSPIGVSQSSEKMWRLVIASVAQKEKAEELASESGYENIQILYVDRLDTYRLVHGSYPSLQDAQNALPATQSKYPETWMAFF